MDKTVLIGNNAGRGGLTSEADGTIIIGHEAGYGLTTAVTKYNYWLSRAARSGVSDIFRLS